MIKKFIKDLLPRRLLPRLLLIFLVPKKQFNSFVKIDGEKLTRTIKTKNIFITVFDLFNINC